MQFYIAISRIQVCLFFIGPPVILKASCMSRLQCQPALFKQKHCKERSVTVKESHVGRSACSAPRRRDRVDRGNDRRGNRSANRLLLHKNPCTGFIEARKRRLSRNSPNNPVCITSAVKLPNSKVLLNASFFPLRIHQRHHRHRPFWSVISSWSTCLRTRQTAPKRWRQTLNVVLRVS